MGEELDEMAAIGKLTASALLGVLLTGPLLATPVEAGPASEAPPRLGATGQQDGRHDFDFEIGRWKATVRKLVHPLSHSTQWDQLTGVVVTRSLPMLEGWNESEMQVDSPVSHNHIELLAVRLFNPQTRQWAIYGSSIKTGSFDPPMIGRFRGGRGSSTHRTPSTAKRYGCASSGRASLRTGPGSSRPSPRTAARPGSRIGSMKASGYRAHRS